MAHLRLRRRVGSIAVLLGHILLVLGLLLVLLARLLFRQGCPARRTHGIGLSTRSTLGTVMITHPAVARQLAPATGPSPRSRREPTCGASGRVIQLLSMKH